MQVSSGSGSGKLRPRSEKQKISTSSKKKTRKPGMRILQWNTGGTLTKVEAFGDAIAHLVQHDYDLVVISEQARTERIGASRPLTKLMRTAAQQQFWVAEGNRTAIIGRTATVTLIKELELKKTPRLFATAVEIEHQGMRGVAAALYAPPVKGARQRTCANSANCLGCELARTAAQLRQHGDIWLMAGDINVYVKQWHPGEENGQLTTPQGAHVIESYRGAALRHVMLDGLCTYMQNPQRERKYMQAHFAALDTAHFDEALPRHALTFVKAHKAWTAPLRGDGHKPIELHFVLPDMQRNKKEKFPRVLEWRTNISGSRRKQFHDALTEHVEQQNIAVDKLNVQQLTTLLQDVAKKLKFMRKVNVAVKKQLSKEQIRKRLQSLTQLVNVDKPAGFLFTFAKKLQENERMENIDIVALGIKQRDNAVKAQQFAKKLAALAAAPKSTAFLRNAKRRIDAACRDMSFAAYNAPYQMQELIDTITNADDTSSPGTDGIPYDMLLAPAALEALLRIMNDSWEMARIEQCVRDALIVPISKGKGDASLDSFRPVSLLTTISKLMEGMVRARLVHQLECMQKLSDGQYGARPNRGAPTLTLTLTQFIHNAWAQGRDVLLVALDFSKAFDSIPAELILNELVTMGIKGRMLRWIRALLHNRRGRVKVGNKTSPWFSYKRGTPQGACISSLLFIIGVDAAVRLLQRIVFKGLALCYVDDMHAAVALPRANKGSKQQRAAELEERNARLNTVQTAIYEIQGWARERGMQLNAKKCEWMLFTPAKRTRAAKDIQLFLKSPEFGGKPKSIPRKTVVRVLGVHYDEHLTFNAHIDALLAKAKRRISALEFLTSVCIRRNVWVDTWIIHFLLKMWIRPLFEFATAAWCGTTSTRLNQIHKFEYKLLRKASNHWAEKFCPSHHAMLEAVGLETMDARRAKFTARELCRVAAMNGTAAQQQLTEWQQLMMQRTSVEQRRAHWTSFKHPLYTHEAGQRSAPPVCMRSNAKQSPIEIMLGTGLALGYLNLGSDGMPKFCEPMEQLNTKWLVSTPPWSPSQKLYTMDFVCNTDFPVLGSAGMRSAAQVAAAKQYTANVFAEFLAAHDGENVVVICSDGAANAAIDGGAAGAGVAVSKPSRATQHTRLEDLEIDSTEHIPCGRLASNTDTELVGLCRGAQAAAKCDDTVRAVLLMSDSQVAVKHVANEYDIACSNATKLALKHALEGACRRVTLHVAWEPGHVGQALNEAADVAAKVALAKAKRTGECAEEFRAPFSTMRRVIGRRIERAKTKWWVAKRSNQTNYIKAFLLRETGTFRKCHDALRSCGAQKWQQQTAHQIRTGNVHPIPGAYVRKQGALWCKACDTCINQGQQQFAEHQMWSCTAHQAARRALHARARKEVSLPVPRRHASAMQALRERLLNNENMDVKRLIVLQDGVPQSTTLGVAAALTDALAQYWKAIGYDKVALAYPVHPDKI
jgi:ribonuclease HI